MQWNVSDAYAHVGLPRFGSLAQLIRYMDVHDIGHAAAVLGPRVPDIATLMEAARTYPGRLRGIGIPFGETPEQRLAAVKLQLDAGALGIRLDQREAADNPALLAEIGRRGSWAYGIDSCRSQRLAALYLQWLEEYPQARLAAPHFMYGDFVPGDPERSGGPIAELMNHPRFCGILVRNLGMCGSEYPHEPYKPWVEFALEQCGSEHLMWGSEYPVLFWRNERAEAAVGMFRELLGACSDEQFARIAGTNVRELLFAEPPMPKVAETAIPEWIERQFERERNVPFFPRGWEIPVQQYGRLLDCYIHSKEFAQGMSMAEFLLKAVDESAARGGR